MTSSKIVMGNVEPLRKRIKELEIEILKLQKTKSDVEIGDLRPVFDSWGQFTGTYMRN